MFGFLQKNTNEINKVVLIPVHAIDPNPHQPRKFFDQDHLSELAESIQQNGLLQPITVRKLPSGRYELIAGERRTLAYRLLEYQQIPAIVENYTDEQSAIMSLIENLQRKDLNYFEEAEGIARLMRELSLTQQQVSEKLGKAQPTIANKLRLLKYSAAVQRSFLENNLTERHARALLKLKKEEQQLVAISYIAENKLNVEQTEEFIQKITEDRPQPAQKNRIYVIKDMRIFINSINRAITTMNHAGIPVKTETSEDDRFIEYLIRVPKSAVYRHSTSAKTQAMAENT